MWHNIAEHKNKHKGKKAIVVGTGPSADSLKHKDEILIGVNRAIILSENYSYVFVDSDYSLDVVAKYHKNTKYICVPFWAREKMTQNAPIVKTLQDKILLFALTYECPSIYNAPEYSLNDSLLHIYWGTVQPALHFCKLIGISEIKLCGVDGTVEKETNCKKIEKTFGIPKKRIQRTIEDYKKTKQKINEISKFIGIKID